MATRLETLLATGELQRAAAREDVKTQADLAKAIGVSRDAYEKCKARILKQGRPFPSLDELKRAGVMYRDLDTNIENSIPNPGPAVPEMGKWPNVAAFDAGGEGPPLPAIPAGYRVDKLSTLVDAQTGEAKLQWIKTSAERETLLDAIRHLCAEAPRLDPIAPPPADLDDDLLCVLPVGDPHFGASITGDDAADIEAIERNLYAAVDQLVSLAPRAQNAWLASVGDTAHHNGQRTTANGTRVGGASTALMFGTTLRAFRRLALRCAERFGHTRVTIVPGNHDADMAPALSAALALLLEGNDRITVDTGENECEWYRFGLVLLGLTHGDKAKAVELMGTMAVDCARDWGETVHRRIYAGHVHHEVAKEVHGVTIEHLRTLAPLDDWHKRHGYRAGRDMRMDVWHRVRGQINRHIVGIEQLRRSA